jgi:hypothetical protein
MKWVGNIACMGEVRNSYKVLDGKPEGKRPLRRSRHRWLCIIRMDFWGNRVEICGLDLSVSA